MMDLSIIIASCNTKDILKKCLLCIKNSGDSFAKEIIVVDNGSTDGSAGLIKDEFKDVILIENKENLGFAYANIQGVNISKGKYILLLNSDLFIESDTLKKTIAYMEDQPQCGILGAKLIDGNGVLKPSARRFPTPWRIFLEASGIALKFRNIPFLSGIDNLEREHNSIRETDWVPGCYFLMRRQMIEKTGFFDKRFFLYYEEIDLCLRAKRHGWKIVFYPAQVTHLGGETAKRIGSVTEHGKQLEKAKIKSEFIYFRKNYGLPAVFLDKFFIALLAVTRKGKQYVQKYT